MSGSAAYGQRADRDSMSRRRPLAVKVGGVHGACFRVRDEFLCYRRPRHGSVVLPFRIPGEAGKASRR
jgi:hypothetical protein